MTASYQNKLFSIITLVILSPVLLGFSIPSYVEIAILILALTVTGIPHGAIDHVIYSQKTDFQGSKQQIWMRFFLPYLTLIFLTMILWLWLPTFMFWFFMVVSAYHFGQSQLYHIQLAETNLVKILLYCLWGTSLLSTLWLFNWDDFANIIRTVFSWELLREGLLYTLLKAIAVISVIGTFCGLVLMVFRKKLSLKMCLQEIGVMVLLALLLHFTSLYMAFAVYFGLWHATRVMITEYQFLIKNQEPRPTLLSFLKPFLPFSLLSLVGVGILLVGAQLLQATIAPFMLFMVFISALTMPHAYFMHGMYQVLHKRTKAKPYTKLSGSVS